MQLHGGSIVAGGSFGRVAGKVVDGGNASKYSHSLRVQYIVTTSLTRDAVPMVRIVSTFLFIHVDSEKSMKVDT